MPARRVQLRCDFVDRFQVSYGDCDFSASLRQHADRVDADPGGAAARQARSRVGAEA